MKKERIFYLDFVRAFATITILLTHYNARYLFYYMTPEMPENAIISLYPFNIYIGNLGVSLFFIISGAALMYVYKEKCALKNFYHKRFLSIYPMFWIAYFIAFLYLFFCTKQLPYSGLSKINFLYTILGMDGYLIGCVPSFYILGEWFLGCIILLYLIFPLIRKLLLSYPWWLCFVSILLYLPFALHNWFPNFGAAKLIWVRLPEFLFGMLFIEKIKTVRPWMLFSSLIILILNTLLKPAFPDSIQTTYIGISFFVVLVFISQYLNKQPIRLLCHTIGKYSYACFLTHHFIIDQICSTFPMETLSRSGRYMLFILCASVTAVASWLLYSLHSHIMKYIHTAFAKTS